MTTKTPRKNTATHPSTKGKAATSSPCQKATTRLKVKSKNKAQSTPLSKVKPNAKAASAKTKVKTTSQNKISTPKKERPLLATPKVRTRSSKTPTVESIIEPHFHNRRSPSLLKTYPDVAAQWHYKKNCGFGPEDFSSGSSIVAWWKCKKCNHIWSCAIRHRTINASGCPHCTFKHTDLHDFPEALKQFDRRLNKGIDPSWLYAQGVYWWRCDQGKDHVWQSGFYRRDGQRCPFCLGFKVSKTNSLRNFPKLYKEFHPTKNKKLKADDVIASSKQEIWWQCKKGHEWKRAINLRTQRGSQCPVCSGQVISDSNCLASVCPEVAREWHAKRNGKIKPDQIRAKSVEKYWFICRACGNEWQATPYNRTVRGCGCPPCAAKERGLRLSKLNERKRKKRARGVG